MAKYVDVPSNAKLYIHGNSLRQPLISHKNSHIQIQRKHKFGGCKTIHIPQLNVSKSIIHPSTNLKGRVLKCYCLGALQNVESDWFRIFDRGLLVASMLLTYIAGVIPIEKSLSNARNTISSDEVGPESSSYPGSDEEVSSKLMWDTVGKKLMDSLTAIKDREDFGNKVSEIEQKFEKRPSSLSALAVGPRLRLLSACFQWLKKEVNTISEDSETISIEDITVIFKGIIQSSCQPLCMNWLKEELRLENTKYDKALFSVMVGKLDAYESILQNIKKLGKEDLYAELISILRFGFVRKSGYYGYNLFIEHGVKILEDLVITLADGIANKYLELISVDSNVYNEANSIELSLCTLSTRQLQKLRNEVALNQWLHQNMEAVASMYEDRFDIFTLESQVFDECSKREDESKKWWMNLRVKRDEESLVSPLYSVVISHVSLTVKRIKELRALTGWRYYFSLYLELSDIAMPVIRSIITKVSEAISFFLVSLIGRSVGLIYTGIRQSLRWK